MHALRERVPFLVFTARYIVNFSAYFIVQKNYEFIWYIAVVLLFFFLI